MEARVLEKLDITINGRSYALKDIEAATLVDIVGHEIGYCICWGDGGASEMRFNDMMKIVAANDEDTALILYIESESPIFPKGDIEGEDSDKSPLKRH